MTQTQVFTTAFNFSLLPDFFFHVFVYQEAEGGSNLSCRCSFGVNESFLPRLEWFQ